MTPPHTNIFMLSHRLLTVAGVLLTVSSASMAADGGWIDLSSDAKTRQGWREVSKDWIIAGSAAMHAEKPRTLTSEPGDGVIVNGPKGWARNLISKQKFTDAEVHVEFLIPKQSNSGVKLMGLYEIQILDSHVNHCVADALSSGNEREAETKTKELLEAVQRFAKMR